MSLLSNHTSQLYNWVGNNLELTIAIFVPIFGWVISHYLLINAQDRQHKNEINHEVYKELILELDRYANQISDFSSKVQGYRFTKIYTGTGRHEKVMREWVNDVISSGNHLEFYRFLQKWESYEIFVQDIQEIMLILKRENDKIRKNFQELFLYNDPAQTDRKQFEIKTDELFELTNTVSCYVMDFKKVLQNYFYRQYGLKLVKPRTPEDSKYLVLTRKGLVPVRKLQRVRSLIYTLRKLRLPKMMVSLRTKKAVPK
jgi:hypothetical protein